jgi:hypothetical protein
MDRLAAYFHWNRQPELRRQVRQLIATMDPKGAVDWEDLYAWATQRESRGRTSMTCAGGGRSGVESGNKSDCAYARHFKSWISRKIHRDDFAPT